MWGATQYPDVIGGMVNTLMWDEEMKMKRQNQLKEMLDDLNPAELMAPVIQEEQINKLDKIQNEIIERSKFKDGRLSTEDMMDIDFSMRKFEKWQTNKIAMQNAFAQDYKFGQDNLKKIRPDVFFAGIETFMKTGDYQPGSMLKRRLVNLHEHFSKRKIAGRENPLDIRANVVKGDLPNTFFEIKTSEWAKQHEREAVVLSDYSTNPDIKEAIDEWYDGFDGPEKVLWEDQMEKYNNTRDVAAGEPEIKNPALYTGMKMWSGVIMPNTRDVNIKTFAPKKPEEVKPPEGTELGLTNQGTPVELVRQMNIGGKQPHVNYGSFIEHPLTPLPKGKKLPLDNNTFFLSLPADFNPADLGKPATEAKTASGQSAVGQSYLLENAWVYEDMPIYMGDEPETFKVKYGEDRTLLGRRKGNVTLYKNQPIPQDVLSEIQALKGGEYDSWKDKNVGEAPVIRMSLKAGAYGTIEALKVFDDGLAKDLNVINPEFELKASLPKEPKPGKEHVYVDALGNEFTQEEKGLTDEQIQEALRLNKITRK
jgi:hypothetical protein